MCMIYININNWRKPIFRILKSKKETIKQSKPKKRGYLKKFDEFTEQTEPAVKLVYEVVNNEIISKLETRQNTNNYNSEYVNYISNKLSERLGNNNCSYLLE